MSSKRSLRPADRLAATVLLLAVAGGGSATASAAGGGFDRSVRSLAAHCVDAASTSCAEQVFALADTNRDGKADLAEVTMLNDRLRVWTRLNADSVPPPDLKALNLGFLLIDTIGLERFMLLYDADGDGSVSLAEATADLNLDHRPLPQLVEQRELVDWPSLRRRFGATALVFDYLGIR